MRTKLIALRGQGRRRHHACAGLPWWQATGRHRRHKCTSWQHPRSELMLHTMNGGCDEARWCGCVCGVLTASSTFVCATHIMNGTPNSSMHCDCCCALNTQGTQVPQARFSRARQAIRGFPSQASQKCTQFCMRKMRQGVEIVHTADSYPDACDLLLH